MRHKPIGIQIFAYLSIIANFLFVVFALMNMGSKNTIPLAAVAVYCSFLIYASFALLSAKNWARWVFTFTLVVAITEEIFTAKNMMEIFSQTVVSGIFLYVLYNRSGDEFFKAG